MSNSRFDKVPIENVRRYWNNRPCNIRHSQKEVGTKEYFDEVESRKYYVEPHIPDFAQFSKWNGKRVLEIGCGIGTDTINFARAGAIVSSVDLSEVSLKVAKQRAQVFDVNNVTFYCANAEELSSTVPPEPYDLVYSFGAIHHTPNPGKILEQIRKNYMAAGSTLKIMVYHRYSWKALWTLLVFGHGAFWRFDDVISRHSEAQEGCPITYTYSRKQIDTLLKGFEIKDISVAHIFPYRIRDYVKYKYIKNWYFRLVPDRLFRWMESQIGWHLCVTAKIKTGQNQS